MLGTALGLLVTPVLRLVVSVASSDSREAFGVDYRFYTMVATRWMDGGSYFEPWQLAGPHPISSGEVLYPPVVLWLLVPFSYLPAILWWAIPIAGLVWAIRRMRPDPWAQPLMALCVAAPGSPAVVWFGQPTVQLPTFIALALLGGGWGAMVFLKPSLFPFAFIGMTRRAWWATVAMLMAASLPFGTLWIDWIQAIINSDGGVFYSISQVPAMLLPVVAWLGRRTSPSGPPRP